MSEYNHAPTNSDLPLEIQKTLQREILPLSEAAIGSSLRSLEELEDVKDVISRIKEAPCVAIGLFGSRLRGRLRYEPKDLFDKMQTHYGREDLPTVPDALTCITSVLAKIECEVSKGTRACDIPLPLLLTPPELDTISTSRLYIPSDLMPGDSGSISFSSLYDKVPLPATLLVPDIDIAVITREQLDEPLHVSIGERSGTMIQVNYISPGTDEDVSLVNDVRGSIISDFRPLSV